VTKAASLLWVLDHLDDLDADFRAYYRIDGVGDEEFGTLTGPRFFALAERVFCYGGATYHAARMSGGTGPDESGDLLATETVVDSSPGVLLTNPDLSALIDYN
jgi:hypothetical protein